MMVINFINCLRVMRIDVGPVLRAGHAILEIRYVRTRCVLLLN